MDFQIDILIKWHVEVKNQFLIVWRTVLCKSFSHPLILSFISKTYTMLQHKLRLLRSLALDAATTRSSYCCTMMRHCENKLVCHICIDSLPWHKNSLFDSRHGLLSNLFLLLRNNFQWGFGQESFMAMGWLVSLSLVIFLCDIMFNLVKR